MLFRKSSLDLVMTLYFYKISKLKKIEDNPTTNATNVNAQISTFTRSCLRAAFALPSPCHIVSSKFILTLLRRRCR